jgi:hypothetical protein
MMGRPGHLLALPALLLAGAGCVVPVGPEWTDPQGNRPPTISDATPAIGSILDFGTTGNAAQGLEVVLADPDTNDNLYARWIIDYPPYVDGVSHVADLPVSLPGGDQVNRSPIRFAPNCSDDAISHTFSNHRLLLAVSDRPFANGEDTSQPPLDGVTNGFLVEGSWIFTLDCP